MKKPSGRCPFCARAGAICWVMPCLEFQAAIDSSDDKTVRVWAIAVGVAIGKVDGAWLGSRRLVKIAKSMPKPLQPDTRIETAGRPR